MAPFDPKREGRNLPEYIQQHYNWLSLFFSCLLLGCQMLMPIKCSCLQVTCDGVNLFNLCVPFLCEHFHSLNKSSIKPAEDGDRRICWLLCSMGQGRLTHSPWQCISVQVYMRRISIVCNVSANSIGIAMKVHCSCFSTWGNEAFCRLHAFYNLLKGFYSMQTSSCVFHLHS